MFWYGSMDVYSTVSNHGLVLVPKLEAQLWWAAEPLPATSLFTESTSAYSDTQETFTHFCDRNQIWDFKKLRKTWRLIFEFGAKKVNQTWIVDWHRCDPLVIFHAFHRWKNVQQKHCCWRRPGQGRASFSKLIVNIIEYCFAWSLSP